MWEPRVHALEERTGRIESKLDAVAVKLDLMADQQAEMRADMKAMAGDLKSVELAQANMQGQLTRMPSTLDDDGYVLGCLAHPGGVDPHRPCRAADLAGVDVRRSVLTVLYRPTARVTRFPGCRHAAS